MLVDLLEVTTSDGVRLHGALETPQSPADARGVDVWLLLHGTGSNFYAASTLAALAPKLLAGGAAVLRANTRGHDIICTGPSLAGRAFLGAAFERVDESPRDLRAWITHLAERGFQRIGVLGHSLGAIKAIVTLALDDAPPVARLVAASPPRLSHAHFCASASRDEFLKIYAEAQSRFDAGRGDELMFVRFPLPYYVSAAGFLDRYGVDEKYNVLKHLAQVKCPTLVTYGSAELRSGVAFSGMPEAIEGLGLGAEQVRVAVIAGADHLYTGCHDALAAVVQKIRMKAEG